MVVIYMNAKAEFSAIIVEFLHTLTAKEWHRACHLRYVGALDGLQLAHFVPCKTF
jgi:hypothetical protein